MAGEGPAFHGPVHGSQFAWGNRDVTQQQYTGGLDIEKLSEAIQLIRRQMGELGLPPEQETQTLEAVEDLDTEVRRAAPDNGRLRRLTDRVVGVLVGGSGAGAAPASPLAAALVLALEQAAG